MKAFSLLAGLSLAFAAAGAAADTPASIKAKGVIVAAIVPNYPPLEFKDPATDKLTGIDVDLGEALAAKLGVKIRWEETGFAEMITSLTTGRVDIILSGMTDRPERREAATFVDYMKSGPQFYTTAARGPEFKSMTALCGKSVGASRRTSFPTEIAEWSEANCVKLGKEPIKVVGTEGSADARTQLKQGRVDAAMQGNETIPYMMLVEPNAYAAVGEPLSFQYTAIGIAKPNTELKDAVAAAFGQLIAEGTYQKILAKWSLPDNAVSKVTINAGE
jgi:polar amino acid transport system substrate-binding protein